MPKTNLKLLITGSPGTGKTTISKAVAKELKCMAINEKEFAFANKIGKWNTEENELEIGPKELEKALNKELSKHDRIVVEGHILCETKLDVDYAIVLRIDPELLEMRLERRNYNPEKMMDNVFCEGIDYCRKHLAKKYPKKRIIEVQSQKTIKETKALIIKELKAKGATI